MASGPLQKDVLEQYRGDGYVLARGMFDAEEIELLRRSAKRDKAFDDHSYSRADAEGGTIRLALWNRPGDTIHGMSARCRSIVDSAELRSAPVEWQRPTC
ncbi:MAG: hypothetical protein ABSH09_28235 [Bryobacteraceae bacterium]